MKTFVLGSAIGYYPTSEMSTYDESYSGPASDTFGGKLCSAWEDLMKDLRPETRKAVVRTGVVLGQNGGALQQLMPLYKVFLINY